MTEKEDKRKKIAEQHNKELKFKPEILPKSRELSRSTSRSGQLKLKYWENSKRESKDSLLY